MTSLDQHFGELRSRLQNPITTRTQRHALIQLLTQARTKNQDQFDEVWRPYLLAHQLPDPFWSVHSPEEAQTLEQTICGARFRLSVAHWGFTSNEDWQRLARNPKLKYISGLSTYGKDLSYKNLQTILDSPHLKTLKELDLAEVRDLDTLQPILMSTKLQHLETLILDSTNLPKEAITALAYTKALPSLQTLGLNNLYIERQIIERIEANPNFNKLENIEYTPTMIYG